MKRSVNDVGTGLGILQRSFGFHHADAVLAVVEHQKRVALSDVLVLGKVNALNISRGAEVDRRKVLLDLRVVAGLVVFIVKEEADNLEDAPCQDGNANGAHDELAHALFLQFLCILCRRSGLLVLGFHIFLIDVADYFKSWSSLPVSLSKVRFDTI